MDLLWSSSDIKYLASALGLAIGFVGFVWYVYGMFRGTNRPHFFSWLLWTVVMVIGYIAQRTGGGGPGSIVLGLAAVTTGIVCVLALFKGERSGTRFDWMCLIIALSAIPLWLITDSLLLSVVVVTGIDLVAYGPTFRKSWADPYGEPIACWIIGGLQFLLAVVALENYSLLTCLYPITMIIAQFALVSVLLVRTRPSRGG